MSLILFVAVAVAVAVANAGRRRLHVQTIDHLLDALQLRRRIGRIRLGQAADR